MRLTGGVAESTGHGRVRTAEWMIRPVVIEGLGVEAHDVGLASLVLAVTAAAGTRRRRGMKTMEARTRSLIGFDGLVAVEAETPLRIPLERPVTAAAFVLDIGVARDHRAGHDELLEVHRMRPLRP